MDYAVEPLSRQDIRKFAMKIRKIVGLADTFYFPIVGFIEYTMVELDNKFNFEVCKVSEMSNNHGLMVPDQNLIRIREDVYERAIENSGRDRTTIAHELGHYMIHLPQSISFPRKFEKEIMPAYVSSEWQAKAFAGELLMPAHLCWDLSPEEIVEKCAVSYEAASYQKHVFQLKSITRERGDVYA